MDSLQRTHWPRYNKKYSLKECITNELSVCGQFVNSGEG